MKKTTVFLVMMLCILSRSYAQKAAPQKSATDPFILPFTLNAWGEISVMVHLPNHLPVAFLLDTAWPDSSCSKALAQQLGLPIKTRRENIVEVDHIATIPKLALGALTLHDMSFVIEPKIAINEEDVGNYEGILGEDFFAHYAVFFDFDRHELRLWKNGGLSAAQRKQIGMETAFSTPIARHLTTSGYYVSVQFPGGQKAELALDTGSVVTLLTETFARRLGMELRGVSTLETAYGEVSGSAGFVKTLSVGDFTMYDVPVTVTGTEKFGMVLGRNFLLQHQLLIDCPHKTFYFKLRSQKATVLPWLPSPSGIPLLDVTLSDGKSHLFGIDTNIDCAMVQAVAQRLAAAVPASHLIKGKEYDILHSRVSVPGTSFVDANILFSAEDAEPLLPGMPARDGEIGQNVLKVCALRLNFSQRRLEWIMPGHLAGTTYVNAKMVRLPLLDTDSGYLVEGKVNGKDAVFSFGLTSADTALKSSELAASVKSAETAGGAMHLRTLTLGGLTVENVPVREASNEEKTDAKAGEKSLTPAVELGVDFLRRFEVIFDFAGGTMYLTPDPDFKESPK